MDTVFLSGPTTDTYVECSRSNVKTKGKLFKKQIFRWGEFSHPLNPAHKVKVDRAFYDSLKKNFDNGVCPIVQVPLVNENNQHVESPEKNIGVVVDMSAEEDGVYVYMDIRRHAEDVGETILGASAKLHLDYVDNRTNTRVGPTLLHVAPTNRPYLVDLKDFETISASNADTNEEVVLLLSDGDSVEPNSEEEPSMTKDELIAQLSEYGVDVEAGQRALAEAQGFAALSDVLGGDVVATPEAISNTIVDLTNSLQERETRVQELTAEIQEVNLSKATAEVEALIEKARILPAWKDDMIDLAMTDRERFERFLIPEEQAKLELSEEGFTSAEATLEEDPAARAKAEGERLAALTK